MTLQRREFSIGLLGSALGAGAAPASAQRKGAVEGVHYVRLEQRAPAGVPGKIEVVEFFWYECPYCNAFEPALESWSQRLPGDVVLHRVPVWFQEVPFAAQQRLFYTLEALGLTATLHRRAFASIHRDRARLRTPEDMAAFALQNGADPMRFMATFASPEVQAQVLKARQLAEAYKIDAVPAVGVQGRFYTNGNLANAGLAPQSPAATNARLLGVVDALVERARRGT